MEGRIQGKPTKVRKRNGMLSDLIGKEDYASLKKRFIEISGETG